MVETEEACLVCSGVLADCLVSCMLRNEAVLQFLRNWSRRLESKLIKSIVDVVVGDRPL